MDAQQQIQQLQSIKKDSDGLLEATSSEIVPHPRPCWVLLFKRGKCPWLEKEEEVSVIVDIQTVRSMENDIPYLKFTSYFPYPVLRHDDIHLRFILLTLENICKKWPFMELGVVLNREKQEVLSFRCSRLFTDAPAPEIMFYVNQVVIAIELFVGRYESFLKQNGVRLT